MKRIKQPINFKELDPATLRGKDLLKALDIVIKDIYKILNELKDNANETR